MLQLQETRKKWRHLLRKPATFIGFRHDSETQFVPREICGEIEETGAPIPISHLYVLPKPIPGCAPRICKTKPHPGMCPGFFGDQHPWQHHSATPPQLPRRSVSAAPWPASSVAVSAQYPRSWSPSGDRAEGRGERGGRRFRASPAEQTLGARGGHLRAFALPSRREPSALITSSPTSSGFEG